MKYIVFLDSDILGYCETEQEAKDFIAKKADIIENNLLDQNISPNSSVNAVFRQNIPNGLNIFTSHLGLLIPSWTYTQQENKLSYKQIQNISELN